MGVFTTFSHDFLPPYVLPGPGRRRARRGGGPRGQVSHVTLHRPRAAAADRTFCVATFNLPDHVSSVKRLQRAIVHIGHKCRPFTQRVSAVKMNSSLFSPKRRSRLLHRRPYVQRAAGNRSASPSFRRRDLADLEALCASLLVGRGSTSSTTSPRSRRRPA